MTRPPVEIHKRKPPTLKQQVSILLRQARCWLCGKGLLKTGVEYDHLKPLALGGKNEVENFYALCPDCHSIKTKADVEAIARAKRRSGEKGQRARREKRGGSSIQSRGFDKRFKKKMNGEVVENENDTAHEFPETHRGE